MLCLTTRGVILALFVGSWISSTMVNTWNPIYSFDAVIENI